MNGIEARLQLMRRNFIESLWGGMLLTACIGVPVSVFRAMSTGWLPVYTSHIMLGLLVALVMALRKKISFNWLSGLLVLLLWSVSIPGLMTFGLAASSVLWLMLSCLIASYLFSVRIALYVALGTAVIIAVIGWAVITQRIHPAVVWEDYQLMPSAWATLLIATGTFLYFVVRSVGSQNEALMQLLHEVEEQRKVIELSATHDQLTGLPTHSLVEDRLSVALAAAGRGQDRVALMFIDLDGFKGINDSYGHGVGDAILRKTADRMTNCVRASDTVARIGGDEFLVVAREFQALAEMQALAEKLIAAISQPVDVGDAQLAIGASIGIAVYPDHSMSGTELRRLADLAMYEAKRQGKGRVHFAKPPFADPAIYSFAISTSD